MESVDKALLAIALPSPVMKTAQMSSGYFAVNSAGYRLTCDHGRM